MANYIELIVSKNWGS